MRILLATDAWEPQVNGVVRTLTRIVAELREMGDEVEVISPDQFPTFPLPTYPEIKLAVGAYEKVQERFKSFEPEAIHIATEGPIGLAARRICMEWKLPFTTSYHTRFPEYVSARLPVPLAAGYAYMKWFHSPSGRLMVATPTLRDELARHGFRNLSQWSRGVDTERLPSAPAGRAGRLSPACSGRSSSTSAASRWRRTSRPSSSSTCRAPRWWSATARSARNWPASYPEVVFAGAKFGEELSRLLRRRRRLRLPLAHRHLRPGAAGGDGVRHAGGGLLGARARSTSSPAPAPASSRRDQSDGPAAKPASPASSSTATRCAPSPSSSPGAPAPRSSAATCSPIPEPEKSRFWRRLRRLARLRRGPKRVEQSAPPAQPSA